MLAHKLWRLWDQSISCVVWCSHTYPIYMPYSGYTLNLTLTLLKPERSFEKISRGQNKTKHELACIAVLPKLVGWAIGPPFEGDHPEEYGINNCTLIVTSPPQTPTCFVHITKFVMRQNWYFPNYITEQTNKPTSLPSTTTMNTTTRGTKVNQIWKQYKNETPMSNPPPK